jgi:hypothetical protein
MPNRRARLPYIASRRGKSNKSLSGSSFALSAMIVPPVCPLLAVTRLEPSIPRVPNLDSEAHQNVRGLSAVWRSLAGKVIDGTLAAAALDRPPALPADQR